MLSFFQVAFSLLLRYLAWIGLFLPKRVSSCFKFLYFSFVLLPFFNYIFFQLLKKPLHMIQTNLF